MSEIDKLENPDSFGNASDDQLIEAEKSKGLTFRQ